MSSEAARTLQRADYTYGEFRVRVESANEGHLRWLEEFLAPHFEPAGGGPVSWRVTLVEDRERFEAMRTLGPREDGAALDVFALDADVVRLPAWRSDDGATTVFEERYPAFYSVFGARREATLVVPDDKPIFRIPLMRVVRELAMNHALRAGGLFLHASAAAFGRRAVVVAGPKGAGKTTLLTYLLTHGARFLSNDRVFATAEAGEFRLRGMPTIVAIRPGTFDLLPALGERLFSTPFFSHRTLDESRRLRFVPERPADGQKVGISPAQYRALLDVEAAGACEAGAVFFPRVTDRVEAFEIERLGVAEAASRLGPALLGVHPWKKTADVFAAPGEPEPLDAASLAVLCRLFAERVRCFECRLGPAAYREDFLASVLARAIESS